MLGDPLIQFLDEDHRLRFIPFGGGGGDRLLQFCERRLIEESASCFAYEEYEVDCLCYHGGGMFGYYDDLHLLEEVGPGPEPLVFFPRACRWRDEEAFERHARVLEAIGRPLVIFARDPVSHREFKRLQEVVYADIRLSHDCAVLYSAIFEADRDLLLTVFREPREDLVGIYCRTDSESSEWPWFTVKGAQAIHLDPGMVGFLSPEHTLTGIGRSSYLAYWHLSYLPSLAVTDRLHVAIARWLFGLPTILFPGREHKIKAAWEHSLAEDPRSLVFVESMEELTWAVEAYGLRLEVQDGQYPRDRSAEVGH